MYRLHAMGINIRHVGEFVIDREHGSGDYLLVIFKTNAWIRIHGEEKPVHPDSAIIYRKGTLQFYRTDCGNYVNHFLHFDMENELADEFIKYDTLLTINNVENVEEILRMISWEQMNVSENKDKYMSLLIDMLLTKLSETETKKVQSIHKKYDSELEKLRAKIYSNPENFQSILQMAAYANLSKSYFQQLYKKKFGISCYDDLLSAKIKTAQYYLTETNLTIKEISVLCGYENDISFMHCFKNRLRITPSEYRKKKMNYFHSEE